MVICILSTYLIDKIAISTIYLSYNDNMREPEYIRGHSESSSSCFLTVPVASGSAVLTFLHAGHSSWPDNDNGLTAVTERGHSHNVYHAILYTAGRNTMIHDGKSHEVSRGALVLTDPGCVHEYRPQSPGGGSFIEITFDLRVGDIAVSDPWNVVISKWLGQEFSERKWPVNIPPPELEHIETLMSETVGILVGTGTYREPAAALAFGRFILELSEYLDNAESSGGIVADNLDKARAVLDKRFTSGITNKELSSVACLSEGAFIRSFTARYGIPPMTYRKDLRITAAKHLLSVSGRSVGEIASNVGYRDIYTFSRVFRSIVGMTASEWRKQQNRDR